MPSTAKDKRPEYRVMAQVLVTTTFNTVGTLTRHPHWFKEAEEVEPIVGPFCRIVETLPKKTLQAIEKKTNGIAMAFGACVLVIPDLLVEVKLRVEEAKARRDAGAAAGPYPTFRQAPGGAGAVPGGAPGNAGEGSGTNGRGTAPWSDTLPPPNL